MGRPKKTEQDTTNAMSSARLKRLIHQLGWTNTDIAAYCGVTDDAVRKWINDKNNITSSARVLLEDLERRVKRGERLKLMVCEA